MEHDLSGSRKLRLEDPTWRILPAALRKYKLDSDHWQDYALFICYGPHGHRKEQCLNYDEKPLLFFQKLKDANKNPIFVLKRIRDIHSPIAIARHKHALQKGSVSLEHASMNAHGPSNSTISPHEPTAAVQGEVVPCPMLNALSRSQPFSKTSRRDCFDNLKSLKVGLEDPTWKVLPAALRKYKLDSELWQDYAMLICYGSPGIGDRSERCLSYDEKPLILFQQLRDAKKNPVFMLKHIKDIRSPIAVVQQALAFYKISPGHTNTSGRGTVYGLGAGVATGASTVISYAVAIYPYLAERGNEFDVAVGDTFVILSRARGWWAVQRDPMGSGVVDINISMQGWVPTGCLLETNVSVASAIAEATAAAKASKFSGLLGKQPIMPLRIVSPSFPGIALIDYKKKGEEELDLTTDDVFKVFKVHHHWSYVVKQDGSRGWVPGWLIGKMSIPPTPDSVRPQQ